MAQYGCKVFKLGGTVKAPEGSYQKFLENLTESPVLLETNKKRKIYSTLHVEDNITFWIGIIESEKSPTTVFQKNENIFSEIKVGGNTNINIFAVNLDTKKGLYGGYWGAIPISQFLIDIHSLYTKFIRKTKAEIVDGNKKRKKEFSTRKLSYPEQVVTRESIEVALQRFKCVTVVQLGITGYDESVTSLGNDIADNIISTGVRYGLKPVLASNSAIVDFIKKSYDHAVKAFKGNQFKHSGKVEGTDSNSNKISISFNDFIDDYLKFEIESCIFDTTMLSTNDVLIDLIERLFKKQDAYLQ